MRKLREVAIFSGRNAEYFSNTSRMCSTSSGLVSVTFICSSVRERLRESVFSVRRKASKNSSDSVQNSNLAYGYNAANDSYGDMFELGIIDPVAVVRNSFLNAVSVASTYITTSVAIVDTEKGETNV